MLNNFGKLKISLIRLCIVVPNALLYVRNHLEFCPRGAKSLPIYGMGWVEGVGCVGVLLVGFGVCF